MGIGRPLAAKLFLEGMEVPLIGATITHSVNQAAIGYIDVVPHESINNIKPRTHVLLSIRDFNRPDLNYPWIDMFEGEVFGLSFGKTADSRTMTLSCIDRSGYWDNALIYFFNAQQSLGKPAQSIQDVGLDFKDAQNQLKQKGIASVSFSNATYFKQIAQQAFSSGGDFIDAIVGLYKKFEEVNEFYASAEDRLRITDRIRVHSSKNVKGLLEEKEALDWFEGILGKSSGYMTLRMAMQDLMSLVFHDYVTAPFPSKVRLLKNEKLRKDPIKSASNVQKTIGEFLFKPNLYMFPPPMCNVFYPDEYSSFQYSRNFFQEPTRLIYRPELPFSLSGGGSVSAPHTYEPQSFRNYMVRTGQDDKDEQGNSLEGPLESDRDQGTFGDSNGDNTGPSNGTNREGQFLTNEERMKGIILVQESMLPASSQFRASLKITAQQRQALYQKVTKYLFFKKRFENRQLQITSHLKPSVVPGFPALVLDPSDANHSVLAYCSSVTHRIYATQGGYTNVQLSFARTPGEQDSVSNQTGEPPIPPWFDESLFGSSSKGKSTFGQGLSDFYSTLLGDKGSESITGKTKTTTTEAAVKALVKEYRIIKSKSLTSIPDLISRQTSRDYTTLREAFAFLGAGTKTKDLNTSWLQFSGYRFSGNASPNPDSVIQGPPAKPDDAAQIKERRRIVENYRNALRNSRGFRG